MRAWVGGQDQGARAVQGSANRQEQTPIQPSPPIASVPCAGGRPRGGRGGRLPNTRRFVAVMPLQGRLRQQLRAQRKPGKTGLEPVPAVLLTMVQEHLVDKSALQQPSPTTYNTKRPPTNQASKQPTKHGVHASPDRHQSPKSPRPWFQVMLLSGRAHHETLQGRVLGF